MYKISDISFELPSNKNVTINVGGKLFVTTYDTLCKSTYFVVKLNSNWLSDDIIDSSPENFVHVLNFMRNHNYPFDKNIAYELDYFGIDYDINKLYDPKSELLKVLNDKLYDSQNKLYNMVNEKFTETISEIIDIYNKLDLIKDDITSLKNIKKEKWDNYKSENNLCRKDGCINLQTKPRYYCREHCDNTYGW